MFKQQHSSKLTINDPYRFIKNISEEFKEVELSKKIQFIKSYTTFFIYLSVLLDHNGSIPLPLDSSNIMNNETLYYYMGLEQTKPTSWIYDN